MKGRSDEEGVIPSEAEGRVEESMEVMAIEGDGDK